MALVMGDSENGVLHSQIPRNINQGLHSWHLWQSMKTKGTNARRLDAMERAEKCP